MLRYLYLKPLIMNDKPVNLKAKAIDFLSRRDYSYSELYNKLKKYSTDLDAIKFVVDEMVSNKYLNEERFIENFIYNKSKKYGSLKVKHLLQTKVSNQELVNDLYQQAEIDELTIARQIWERKFKGEVAISPNDRAKQIRFMISRGFSLDLIFKLLKINSSSANME